MSSKRSKPKLVQSIVKDSQKLSVSENDRAREEHHLSDKQYAWCQQYLQHFNASRASLAVGCQGDPRKHGWRMRHLPAVSSYIDSRLAEHRLSAEIVLAMISEYARSSFEDFLEEGRIDLAKAGEKGVLHYIKRLRQTKDGMSLEIVDPLKALWLLAHIHGLVQTTTRGKNQRNQGEAISAESLLSRWNCMGSEK